MLRNKRALAFGTSRQPAELRTATAHPALPGSEPERSSTNIGKPALPLALALARRPS